MEFEHLTPPPKGIGKESHTDLMITWDDVCVGIEAKYTEGRYASSLVSAMANRPRRVST